MAIIIIGAALIVLGATLLPWLARRSATRAAAFAEVPRYDCAQVGEHGESAPGMRLSVVGTAQPAAAPLRAPASGRECVWYRLTISERHREVDRDSEGRRTTRIVEREVSDERSPDAFAVADATGRVLLDPDGADIDDPVETVDRVESVAGGAGMTLSLGAFSLDIGGSDSLVGVRTRERIIPVGEELYVLAGAGTRDGTGVLGRPREGAFVVSTRSSAELATGARRGMWAWGTAGGLMVAVGAVLVVAGLIG